MSIAPLILVVGPSGAGKDSLMDGACQQLADEPSVLFARRVVTRPSQPGAELHDSMTLAEFERAEAAGKFVLSWRAHGLAYGIPAEVESLRRQGQTVIANVSRSVLADARQRLAPVGIVVVTAAPDVLAYRLARRGRESIEDIRQRLARATVDMPTGPDVRLVQNDRDLADGIRSFMHAISSLRGEGGLTVAPAKNHVADQVG